MTRADAKQIDRLAKRDHMRSLPPSEPLIVRVLLLPVVLWLWVKGEV